MEMREMYSLQDKAKKGFNMDTYKELTKKVNDNRATEEETIKQAFLFLVLIDLEKEQGRQLFVEAVEKYNELLNAGKMTMKELYEIKKQLKKGQTVKITLTENRFNIKNRTIVATVKNTYCKIYQTYSLNKWVSVNVKCEDYFNSDKMQQCKDYKAGLSFVVEYNGYSYELNQSNIVRIATV